MINKPLEIRKGEDPDRFQDVLGGIDSLFGAAFEYAAIGMALISMNGLWIKANRCFTTITGYTLQELQYTDVHTISMREDAEAYREATEQLVTGELPVYQLEKRLVHRTGAMLWVDWNMSLVRDLIGNPVYFIVQIKDITPWKEMERKLSESEQRYKSLIEHNPAGILTFDLSGIVNSVNPAMERILGFTADEMIGRPISRYFVESNSENQSMANLFLVEADSYTLTIKHKNGDSLVLGLKNVPIIVNDVVEGMYIIARDITQHSKDRESLRIAQQDLRDTVRRQQGLTMKFRLTGGKFIHTLCDGELLYRLGYTPSDILNQGLFEIWPPDVAETIEAYYRRAWEGEENVIYEADYNGITYLTSLRPIVEGGKVIEVIGSCVDITERKKMETELRETKELLESFINNTTDAICVLDLDANVMKINDAHERVFGWSMDELKNKQLPIYPEFLKEQQNDIINKLKAGEQISGLETVRVRKDGQLIDVSVTKTPMKNEKGEIIGFAGITRDITERKKTEELLRKSDKLSVAGQLAAGLAHEIRNPLTSLRGFLQLMQNDMQAKQHYFDIMLSELDRINFIVSEFLVIAKPEAIQYKMGDLKEILQSVLALLETQALLCNVELSLEYKAEVSQIICSEMHLKQLFINLVKNSIEAISKGGKIMIVVSMPDRGRIRIRTEDNGCGIPKERLQQLGEPFYTTKEKGTGLGLMMCFKIVEAHKGTMQIKSKPGTGTTIDVVLPVQPKSRA